MRVSCIVEGRTADQLKGKRATHHLDGTHEVMLVTGAPRLLDWHKIDDLTHAIDGEKARDKDIGIWQIQLFTFHPRRIGRSNAEKAAFLSVEQGPKDAGSVKTWNAAPINRAILAH